MAFNNVPLVVTNDGLRTLQDCHKRRVLVPFASCTNMRVRPRYVMAYVRDCTDEEVVRVRTVDGAPIDLLAGQHVLCFQHQQPGQQPGQQSASHMTCAWKRACDLRPGDVLVSGNVAWRFLATRPVVHDEDDSIHAFYLAYGLDAINGNESQTTPVPKRTSPAAHKNARTREPSLSSASWNCCLLQKEDVRRPSSAAAASSSWARFVAMCQQLLFKCISVCACHDQATDGYCAHASPSRVSTDDDGARVHDDQDDAPRLPHPCGQPRKPSLWKSTAECQACFASGALSGAARLHVDDWSSARSASFSPLSASEQRSQTLDALRKQCAFSTERYFFANDDNKADDRNSDHDARSHENKNNNPDNNINRDARSHDNNPDNKRNHEQDREDSNNNTANNNPKDNKRNHERDREDNNTNNNPDNKRNHERDREEDNDTCEETWCMLESGACRNGWATLTAIHLILQSHGVPSRLVRCRHRCQANRSRSSVTSGCHACHACDARCPFHRYQRQRDEHRCLWQVGDVSGETKSHGLPQTLRQRRCANGQQPSKEAANGAPSLGSVRRSRHEPDRDRNEQKGALVVCGPLALQALYRNISFRCCNFKQACLWAFVHLYRIDLETFHPLHTVHSYRGAGIRPKNTYEEVVDSVVRLSVKSHPSYTLDLYNGDHYIANGKIVACRSAEGVFRIGTRSTSSPIIISLPDVDSAAIPAPLLERQKRDRRRTKKRFASS